MNSIFLISNVPIYVSVIFLVVVLSTIYFFYLATKKSNKVLIILLSWSLFQSIMSYIGFYTIVKTFPPRFILLILPPLITMFVIIFTPKGKEFITNLDIKYLTILHIIRLPVEIVLFWLFIYKAIPELMTFEGRNFDIFSGITAPIIYYFYFMNNGLKNNLSKQINKNMLLIWNIICLGLVLNIVIYGILSAESLFQQFAFEQPNRGIIYFPFALLPSVVVPLVIFSHLSSILKIFKEKG